jgi:hypothetical protein
VLRLIHSECGGELEIDKGISPTVTKDGDIYYAVKCVGCNTRLGLLPNIDMAEHFVMDKANRRQYAD